MKTTKHQALLLSTLLMCQREASSSWLRPLPQEQWSQKFRSSEVGMVRVPLTSRARANSESLVVNPETRHASVSVVYYISKAQLSESGSPVQILSVEKTLE